MSSRWGHTAMAKSVRKRTVKTVKTKPTMEQPEVAPDAIPIALPVKEEKKIPTIYVMVCQAGQYESDSWLGLGWAIFKHRLWHLWNDGSFTD